MKRVYLLTGKPGTGKTSLIKKALAGIGGNAGGFYTEEIRERGIRQGFRLVTLDGQSAILAHVNTDSPYRVSKYGVELNNLDNIGVAALQQAAQQCDYIVIDEIGKMELFSDSFRKTVLQIISHSNKKVLGTIMLNSNPFADVIKTHPEVNVITVTAENHATVLEKLHHWIKSRTNIAEASLSL